MTLYTPCVEDLKTDDVFASSPFPRYGDSRPKSFSLEMTKKGGELECEKGGNDRIF